jgi:hypothetical protein
LDIPRSKVILVPRKVYSRIGIMMDFLAYDPGRLPDRPSPKPGEAISIHVEGFPPSKDRHFSIRNRRHPMHHRFVALRQKAYEVMDGRAWYAGPVALRLEFRSSRLEDWEEWVGYLGGIMDSLDGSSGCTFTYLPVTFEDDSQVARVSGEHVIAPQPSYLVNIDFLDPDIQYLT